MKKQDLSLKEYKKELEIMRIVILKSIEKLLRLKVTLTSYQIKIKF